MQKLRSLPKDSLFAFLSLVAVALSLAKPSVVSEAMQKGLALCGHAVIPALFPFFVLTACLLSNSKAVSFLSRPTRPLRRLLGVSQGGAIAFLFGSLFGFPMGARLVAEGVLHGNISKEEGERLLLFSNNASPAFVIGGIGLGMLGSAKKGLFLFLLQFFLSMLVGLVTRKKSTFHEAQSTFCYQKSFPEALRDACLQTITVCGYILFFSVASALCTAPLPYYPLCVLINCVFELGSGCGNAARLPHLLSLPFCAFSVCFSGLSVYFQCKDAIRATSLSMKGYLTVKTAMGTTAAIISFLFCRFSYPWG